MIEFRPEFRFSSQIRTILLGFGLLSLDFGLNSLDLGPKGDDRVRQSAQARKHCLQAALKFCRQGDQNKNQNKDKRKRKKIIYQNMFYTLESFHMICHIIVLPTISMQKLIITNMFSFVMFPNIHRIPFDGSRLNTSKKY